MEAVKEITRMNRLLEVEEISFQNQLEDAVSIFQFLFSNFIFVLPPALSPYPVLIESLCW